MTEELGSDERADSPGVSAESVEGQSARDVLAQFFGRMYGRLIVGTLLFFGLFVGFFVGGVGFHDPDTCWILALGQYIVEHGSLPPTDPYSYTYNFERADPKPFVMYQWLTEVLFYLIFKTGGGTALLMFVGVILSLAFIVIPLRIWGKTGAPAILAATVTMIGVVAGSARSLARPEIFSFLCMGLTLLLIFDMRKEESLKWRYPLLALLIMIVWCNLHSGCVSGLILLAILALVRVGETIFWLAAKTKKGSAPQLMLPLATLLAGALGTLVNPKGIGLWSYVVFSLLSSPINKRIIETRPISFSDLSQYTYYPFFLIVLIFITASCLALKRTLPDPNREGKNFRLLLASIVTGVVCAYLGFATRRVSAFATVALVAETGFVLSPMFVQWRSICISGSWPKFFAAAESVVRPCVPLRLHFVFVILSLSLLGTFLCSTRIVKPEIPQAGTGCPVPKDALAYLKEKMPSGNMLNHPQFGDMMLWSTPQFNPRPKVFIDTRFDMYGAEFLQEYENAAHAKPGWEQVLEKYHVDWVFLPLDFKLIKELRKSDAWTEIFSDKVSVILIRKAS